MHKVILAGALLLFAGTVAALPVTTNTILATGEGALTGDIIVKLLGYRPETAKIGFYGADGFSSREVSFNELEEMLAATSFGGSQNDGPVPVSRCPGIPCGPDAGAGTLNSGPFCDNSSAWIAHSGNPGDAYTVLDSPAATGVTTCGEFYGQTFDWGAVELEALGLTLNGQLQFEGCFSTTWTIHSNGYCANVGTPNDTFLWHWRASGTGVASTIFGFPGAAFDYFLGNGATTGYDLPAGVVGP